MANARTLNCETEDDQTCLEDFQECIEAFQEDLITVPIFIEDDHSFNHSPCTSQVEDFGQKNFNLHNHISNADILENNYLNIKELNRDSIGDSDIDISFQSTNDNCLDHNRKNGDCDNIQLILKNQHAVQIEKSDSFTQSEKPSLSDKDGYETCLDESLSEVNTKLEVSSATTVQILDKNVNIETLESDYCDFDDLTPTNSKVDISNANQFYTNFPISSAKKQVPSSSEPCLPTGCFPNSKHICLDSKFEELKSYDDQVNDACEGDEFFLVQYPSNPSKEVCKSVSEPNVLENSDIPVSSKLTYKLREYYNDYENCLDTYNDMPVFQKVQTEMSDSQIFNEIFLPFKSHSTPDVMDRSFVTLTYDPGPDCGRRKSAFVAGYANNESEMTVIRHIEPDYGNMKDNLDNVLHKHWGSTHVVKVYREPQKSLGISIVGGKVDVQPSEKRAESFLGIFVKNVTSGSPAGKTGLFKTGDRILEVSGIDLREAPHDKAVEAIRSAPNPVVFLIQSLIPWIKSDNENNLPEENEYQSQFLYPASQTSISNQKHVENHDNNDNVRNTEITDVVVDAKPPKTAITETNDIPKFEETKDISERRAAAVDESGSEDDEADTIEMEGRTVSAGGQQIDRASAANIRRTKEEIEADTAEEDAFGYTTREFRRTFRAGQYNAL